MTTPKINVAPVTAGQDAAMYLNSLTDQHLVGSYMDFYVAALGLLPTTPSWSSSSGSAMGSHSPANTA